MLLALWCAVGLASRFSGAEAPTGAPEEAWKKLLAAKEAFHNLEPSSLKPQDFDRFLADFGQKAAALADQFKVYQQRYTNSTHLEEAWSEWMEFLNLAAHGNPTREAELEKAEQQCLNDPQLETSRRESIRYHQVERTRPQAAGTARAAGAAHLEGQPHISARNLLEIAEF